MQGANLKWAQMQGTHLRAVQMDEATNLTSANLTAAAVASIDNDTMAKLAPFFDLVFGDGSVDLPPKQKPDHWKDDDLGVDFWDQWRAWQRSIGFDPDDPANQ
jgi:hypothetical protein